MGFLYRLFEKANYNNDRGDGNYDENGNRIL